MDNETESVSSLESGAFLSEGQRTVIARLLGSQDRKNSNLAQMFTEFSEGVKRKKRKGNTYLEEHGERESSVAKQEFLKMLAKDVSNYGVPTHRLEYLLELVAESVGIKASFFVLPALILMSTELGKFDHQTNLIKTSFGFNMGKLSSVNDLCHEVFLGSMSIEDAMVELKKIRNAPTLSKFSFLLTIPLLSATLCLIGFGGTWIDSAVVLFLGFFVGGFQVLAIDYPNSFGYLFEFISAIFCSLASHGFQEIVKRFGYCINVQKVAFGAISFILPGLELTLSIIEISTRNMVCGNIRMLTSLFTTLLLGFGYSIGQSLVRSDTQTCPSAIPMDWRWNIPLIPFGAFILCIIFQARKSQYFIMVLVTTIGFWTTILTSNVQLLKSNASAISLIATLAIGISSNIYSRVTRDVAAAPILCGILMLVPGSFGLRATLGIIENQGSGENFAVQMFLIAITISVGLFLSNLFIWPLNKKKAISAYLVF